MSQDEKIKTLTIQELLLQDSYIIPIYQRNYAWGDSEIEALLTDMVKACERNFTTNYYIGSLVVYRRNNGQFEVIDGQQRLTTFTLLNAFLHLNNSSRNIAFEYRTESENALDNLRNLDNLPSNFKEAMQSIKRHWNILVRDENKNTVIDFILKNVQIIRTEVPYETDLNHYFEIMNTRGEQLEKHEVLKARFMSELNKSEELKEEHFQTAFARIWDACSDMSRYVVMGFESGIREQIFGKYWQQIPSENFEKIADCYKQKNGNPNTSQKSEEQTLTMEAILNHKSAVKQEKDKETSERFNSVIDFPNFLLHVLRIYHEKHNDLEKAKEVNLDEKNLLDSFKVEDFSTDKIKNLAVLLLQCRYLFDCYVIKSDTTKEQENHWTLKITVNTQSHFLNTFRKKQKNHKGDKGENDTEEQRKIMMLLSMFHVSHPSRIYKNWLYAVLRWLYQNKGSISAENYISFLEDLSNRYYFGHYGKNTDFFELITQENLDMQTAPSEDLLNSGTNVPNFIFNRLDYLLWKSDHYHEKYNDFSEKCKKFRFTFRSSVEHFYPQNPDSSNERLTDADLHSFGNLCLISSSMNSKFSNNMPTAKVANFGKEQNLSLKLSLMMEIASSWGDKTSIQEYENAIKKHGEEMIKLLSGEAK